MGPIEDGMEKIHGYCIICRCKVPVKDPIKTKIRNQKSKNGHVEAWVGNCHHCDTVVYRIIGHGNK